MMRATERIAFNNQRFLFPLRLSLYRRLAALTALVVSCVGCAGVQHEPPVLHELGLVSSKPRLQRLPPPADSSPAVTDAAVQLVSHESDVEEVLRPVVHVAPPQLLPKDPLDLAMADPVPDTDMGDTSAKRVTQPIDLANALGLGGASHLQIKMARERVLQAQADLLQARVMWLPTLRWGIGWNQHGGRLQQTQGEILEVSRNSLFFGGGAGLGDMPLTGASSGPSRMMVNLSLADAFFAKRVAQNVHYSAALASHAVFNDALLQIALTYLDLVQVHGQLANAHTGVCAFREMVELTLVFEESGKATRSEVDRARTQLSLQQRALANLERRAEVISANLARLLRLDPTIVLIPSEVQVAPLEIVNIATPLDDLVAMAIAQRPEQAQHQALAWASGHRTVQEHWRPWLPHVQVGASGGTFGGGQGSARENFGGRGDVDLLAIWQVENLGYGNRALRQRAGSERREACLQVQWVRDQIEMDVVSAVSDVLGFREQMTILEEAIASARETYRLNQLRIREAEGLPLELLHAINSLLQSMDAYVEAVSDYNRAQFRLLRAIGQPPTAP